MDYLTILGENSAEYTEKRSRFIATVRHCETEDEVLKFISKIRARYPDARHNVSAFILRNELRSRFSDDGEPHGTAGKPVLDVIKGSGMVDIAAVVTRYFGGILLGTGGLVRAYSAAARQSLQSAVKTEMRYSVVLKTVCAYADYERLSALILSFGGVITDTDFTENVTVEFSLREGSVSDFNTRLTEKFSGKLSAQEVEKKFISYEIL